MGNPNSYSALNPIEMSAKMQDYAMLTMVSKAIADMKFKSGLKQGSSYDFPYTVDPSRQDYTPGTDLSADSDAATADQLAIDKTPSIMITDNPISQAQRADKSLFAKRDKRSGEVLASGVDQYVLKKGLDAVNARNTVAGGTLTAASLFQATLQAVARIKDYEIGGEGVKAAVDPTNSALMSEYFIANGFNQADSNLNNGFMGRAAGVDFHETNDLEYSATLQMATKPTAGDTVVIKGVTLTFVASIGTDAGNVLIGSAVANSKANLLLLVNDPETTTATGVALAAEDAKMFKNKEVSMAAWGSDESIVTAHGIMYPEETFTDGTDTWGAETSAILISRKNAISLLMQKDLTYYEGREPKRPEVNHIFYQLFGAKVFHRNIKRIAKITFNA